MIFVDTKFAQNLTFININHMLKAILNLNFSY